MQVHTIDLQHQAIARAIAAYLVEGPTGWILVETGPAVTFQTLEAALAERSLAPADLAGVFVTHIHLDHAGASGHLATAGLPIHVHPVGAPHLVDPSRLWRSATRIYGDAMDRLWGQPLPVPEAQVRAVADAELVELAGLGIRALDTPGHAGHHHCWLVEDAAFTGDVAGVRLAGEALVVMPAPPPEIDVESWLASVERLREAAPGRLFPTHFGPSDEVDWHLDRLSQDIRESAEFVRRGLEAGLERDDLAERFVAWKREQARAAGIPDAVQAAYEAANPLDLSVDGLGRYWRKRG